MLFFSHEPLGHLKRHRKVSRVSTFLTHSCPWSTAEGRQLLQIIFPGQGNAAWINSITWYSLSTECGQFSRRSAPFFFFLFQRQFGDLPPEPQQDQQRQTEWSSLKVLVLTLRLGVGFSRWTDTWCGTGGYYANLRATALVFHAFLAIIYDVRVDVWI